MTGGQHALVTSRCCDMGSVCSVMLGRHCTGSRLTEAKLDLRRMLTSLHRTDRRSLPGVAVQLLRADVVQPCQTALRRSADNPDGYCVMAVAENRQTVDFLQVRSDPDHHADPSVDPFSAILALRP